MEGDKYQFLDQMGTSAESHVFWQLLKRMLENADRLNAGMLMLRQHFTRLQKESRLPRSGTIVQQPLTVLLTNLREAADAVERHLQATAMAKATQRSGEPMARKSTAKPTASELESMNELARTRRRMRVAEELQVPLQLRVPDVFNSFYEQKLSEGADWENLMKIPIKCTQDDEIQLEQATQHLLQCTSRGNNGDRPVATRTRRGGVAGAGVGGLNPKKEEISPKRKATVAARLEEAARRCATSTPMASSSDEKPSAGEELPIDPRPRVARGVTTERLRLQAKARAQHQKNEQDLVQKLNEIADSNMRARGLDPTRDKPISTGSETESTDAVAESKPWPKSIPLIKSDFKPFGSEAIRRPEGIPEHWRVFKYCKFDVQRQMVRVNLRLRMELEERQRLIMIDPWSDRSVSGIPQVAQQVEAQAPTVFRLNRPVRVTSTRLEGQAHFHVFNEEVQVKFKTPHGQQLIVYVGYVPHLKNMIVFGAYFLRRFDPTFALSPETENGYLIHRMEKIPIETVRSCLARPDAQRPAIEEERRRWCQE